MQSGLVVQAFVSSFLSFYFSQLLYSKQCNMERDTKSGILFRLYLTGDLSLK